MAVNAKAYQTFTQLVDKLSKWEAASFTSIVQSFDSNGNPTVLFSDGSLATTEKGIALTVKSYSPGTAYDVFGNTATAFVPTVVQICTEANPAGGAGADILGPTELLPLLIECGRTGCIVEWHVTAAGTIPSAAAIVLGTNLKATWKPLYSGIQSAS